jgi:hypothetical protein
MPALNRELVNRDHPNSVEMILSGSKAGQQRSLVDLLHRIPANAKPLRYVLDRESLCELGNLFC